MRFLAAAMDERWRGLGPFMLAAALLAALALQGASPLLAKEHKIFVVEAVPVDETAQDAQQAKMQAILKAQRQAFLALVRRLAGEGAAKRLEKLSDRDIGRMLSSLSITDEQTGANRYIAKIAVRFSPRKVTRFLRKRGIAFITRQSKPVLVLPVWITGEGPVLWEDNPWLKAWRKLASEHDLVPIILPAGDEIDRNTLTAREAMEGDPAALQALQLRYGTDYMLAAYARPEGENALHAAMTGKSPGGKLAFDKRYEVEEGGLDAAAELAVRRFIEVMNMKWRKKVLKRERERRAARVARRMTVVVPFSSLREWQVVRARLVTTPGVRGVDVSTLSGNQAVVRIVTTLRPQALRRALARSGLSLENAGGRWYLRAY